MDAEKIAHLLARKADGKVLRFRETDAQVIVLLVDGRKLYHTKGEPLPRDGSAPQKPTARKTPAKPKDEPQG